MSWSTFCDALALAEQYGDQVSLGGGEPTLYPDFWQALQEAVRSDVECVWLATNGSKREDSRYLAMLAGHCEEDWMDMICFDECWDEDNEGYEQDNPNPRIGWTTFEAWDKFTCALSQDAYHPAIAPETVTAFTSRKLEIRDSTFKVKNHGSAIENQLGGDDECACSDLFVVPDGTVKMCGCGDSLVLGNISTLDEEVLRRLFETRDTHDNCASGTTKELREFITNG
jgi:MoaA/NifB/PqqE/SkfB family radical SAM enzyme